LAETDKRETAFSEKEGMGGNPLLAERAVKFHTKGKRLKESDGKKNGEKKNIKERRGVISVPILPRKGNRKGRREN